MKPTHIGLLVIGAALAGGLAVKMSQPPATSASPAAKVFVPPPPTPVPAARTPSLPTPPSGAVAEADAPPPVYAEPLPAAKPAIVAKAKPPAVIQKAVPPATVEVAKAAPPPAATLPAPAPYVHPPAAEPEQPEVPVAHSEPAREVQPLQIRQVTIPAGTTLPVRLMQTISTEHALAGDTFQATLADPLVIDGFVIAERGARVNGRVLDSKTAGRFSGTSLLQLSLSSLQTADGQRVSIATEPWAKQSSANARERNDAVRIGGGAALGAIIGAIAGGGKGAAIGAGAGGAAGAGSVAMSKPSALEVPTETVIRFRLTARVTIVERPL